MNSKLNNNLLCRASKNYLTQSLTSGTSTHLQQRTVRVTSPVLTGARAQAVIQTAALSVLSSCCGKKDRESWTTATTTHPYEGLQTYYCRPEREFDCLKDTSRKCPRFCPTFALFFVANSQGQTQLEVLCVLQYLYSHIDGVQLL